MINYTFSLVDLEYFLLILIRISMFIYIAPFYGMRGVPNQVKIGLGFFVSILVYQVTLPHNVIVYESVWGYAVVVLKEALTGLLIGFSTSICTSIIGFSGRIIDMETGLSMSNLIDPTTKEMSSMTGVFYQYVIMLMLIVSGMYQYILKALIETFTLIPVNGAVFQSDKLLAAILLFMKDYILIGFRICLPVFAVMLMLNAVLGILAKVSPQMNMFAVGMQLKVLVGLCVLFLTTGMIPGISDFIFTEMKKMMVTFVQTMM